MVKEMRLIVISAVTVLASFVRADTFSICAVDPKTGEVGSAGASCVAGDANFPGALVVSDVHPGRGVIHTQAFWDERNRRNASRLMDAGLSSKQIINWLQAHDADAAPYLRQYGVVEFAKNGRPRSAAFTGNRCMDYKNHITGRTYSIQGNTLLGRQVLEAMQAGFVNTKHEPLADRLMSAMQGAKIVGADVRCKPLGVSSLSAFLIVARPGDAIPYVNLVVPSSDHDPVDVLQDKFNSIVNPN